MSGNGVSDQSREALSLDLAGALAHWRDADWQVLATARPDGGTGDENTRIVALMAAACSQIGRLEQARDLAATIPRQDPAQRRALARILLSAAYDTLGRVSALSGDDAGANHNFRHAVTISGLADDSEVPTLTHQRAFNQTRNLGLLQQAARLVNEELDAALAESPATRTRLEDRIAMLSSEIGTVNHELSIAVARNQLYGRQDGNDRQTLRDRSPSQLGQDLWVLEQTGFKRGGYFVEFGATDGILLSNTYLLEKEFDWQGICVEPNPDYFAQLRDNRSCVVDDACIAARSGDEVEFVLAREYGGIVDFADNDQHAERRHAYRQQQQTVRLRTESLNDVLERLDAPRDIDYISIDTEGSEFEILRTFPFDRWNVSCFTIEHNNSNQRKLIHDLLTRHGYQRTPARWDDWYRR